MSTVVLVGRRADGGQRDRLWRHCKHWWDLHLSLPVHVGKHEGTDPFCLSVAFNRASVQAGDWQYAIITGADWLPGSAAQVEQAVWRAQTYRKLCFAHDHAVMLTEDETEDVLRDSKSLPDPTLGARHPNTFTGVLVIPRALWEDVGGFDERFVGWGGDDQAFWAACCALGGGFKRTSGDIYHLHHPRSYEQNEGNPHHEANVGLMREYLAAKDSRPLMQELLAKR